MSIAQKNSVPEQAAVVAEKPVTCKVKDQKSKCGKKNVQKTGINKEKADVVRSDKDKSRLQSTKAFTKNCTSAIYMFLDVNFMSK